MFVSIEIISIHSFLDGWHSSIPSNFVLLPTLFIQLIFVSIDLISFLIPLGLISVSNTIALIVRHSSRPINPIALFLGSFVFLLSYLVFKVGIILFSLLPLLLLNIVGSRVHSWFRFFFKESFFFELLQVFFNCRLQYVHVVLITHSVLGFFCFFDMSALVVVAPADVAGRHCVWL